jgi:hypothetical protein
MRERGLLLPAQMRATIEERFHTRVKMHKATAFLCEHDSQASRNRRIQNLPSIGFYFEENQDPYLE